MSKDKQKSERILALACTHFLKRLQSVNPITGIYIVDKEDNSSEHILTIVDGELACFDANDYQLSENIKHGDIVEIDL